MSVTRPESVESGNRRRPSDVAIVGMAAILPGAGDVRTFWENTLAKRDAITEVPADRWDWRLYYDADPKAPDKIVSKWGGFVPDTSFDPLRYGMPPTSLPSIEPVQLLLLEATRQAIADAGYADRPFARDRTAVVLGMGGGAAQLAMGYAFRSYLPMLDAVSPGAGRDALEACRGLLPEWTEDSFPGMLLNVAAGRVANRFDLGGANYTVDAACGSSLAAAAAAVRELETGDADVVLLGGADTVQNPFTYLAFSKTQAFSPRGRCRPFDASADGIVISEGVAVLVLKRLADAERDGDRIYAVIKGLGASSDGRARGLTAPGPEGQVRALERAYARAGVEPATVGYVEAHGTGTAVGDVVEVNAIAGVYRDRGVVAGSAAIGSVKSMIGHTKCAAGLAGLINAALALHHRVLPPTIGVDTINPRADLAGSGPFRVNTEPRPWVHAGTEFPRRAAVSAFGFGGTNFHAVLEAHDRADRSPSSPTRDWPAEILVWRESDPNRLRTNLVRLIESLEAGARPRLRDLAHAVNAASPPGDHAGPTLAIVAETLDDLRGKLGTALEARANGLTRLDDPRGIFYEFRPAFRGASVAFLFPGQGSQTPGMLTDLAIAFDEVRDGFDQTDAGLIAAGRTPVGPLVFPAQGDEDGNRVALMATPAAQTALGAAGVGLLRLLRSLGIEPDMAAGHSFGELVALHAAGCLSIAGLAELAHERGRLIQAALGDEPGAMAAIAAGPDVVAGLIAGFEGVATANENGPSQTVISGPRDQIDRLIAEAERAGLRARILPVAGAFHSAKLDPIREPLAQAAAARIAASPVRPVYSNLDARPYPFDPTVIASRVGDHAASPVQFAGMVEAMHADGARVFVEVGPGSVLTSLVGAILKDRPHLAVGVDRPGRPGIPALLFALAKLVVAGVPVRLDRLALGRSDRTLDLARLPVGDGSPPVAPSTWLVNGTRARPIDQPESRRLGHGPALPLPPVERPAPSPDRNGSTPGVPSNGKAMNLKYSSRFPISEVSSHAPAPAGADERVLADFQESMRAFLEVQKTTMLAYLAGRPRAGATMPGGVGGEVTSPHSRPFPEVGREPEEPVSLALHNGNGSANHHYPRTGEGRGQAVANGSEQSRLVKGSGSTESVPNGPGREDVAARLVEIVRDRTGYPAEMLGLDLDLEAELGIDSIKRVEILGTLRDSFPALGGSSGSADMDALARARTLGAIVTRVGSMLQARAAKSEPEPDPVVAPRKLTPIAETVPGGVRRFVLEAVAAPLANEESGLLPGGMVIVTDDGRGIARLVAEGLEAAGHPVELAGPDAADFSSPASVKDFLDRAASEGGDLTGIIHALPLRSATDAGLEPSAWADRVGPEVRGLFLLAQAAASHLEGASRRGGGALVAATGMGGGFASVGPVVDFFPGHGGVAGLVKTLAREWPGVRCRVVDLDPRLEPRGLADRLIREFRTDDDWSEVGYLGDRRVRLRARPSPLQSNNPLAIELAPGEPIVVTGGARGITAAVALELADRWKATILLVGRSPLPDPVENSETAGLVHPAEIKAALHARLRGVGGPADLERAYQGLLRAREIRANLAAFRAAGAMVDYAQADVRDAGALATILDGWRRRFGEPVGLIHGAGVIKDKLIQDKTVGSFDEVMGTKLDGALNLVRLLRPESIRFAALFSSISGRFGNVGQSDYAAANEILDKLGVWLDRRWPGRVVSLIWGPWSGVGMVSDLEGHLGGRGLGMISPESGRSILLDELRSGRAGEVEIIAAGDLGGLDGPLIRVEPRRVQVAR